MIADEPLGNARRRVWWSWFAVIALLCVTWGIATPLFGSPDEAAHAIRAAAVGRGELGAHDKFVELGYTSTVRVPGTWGRLWTSTLCYQGKPEVTPNCMARVHADTTLRSTLTVAGRYPPLYYLGIAPIARLFPSRPGVFLMRALVALVCAALLASAFVSAQALGRWAVLGVAAAITPLVLYLGGVVNPSGLEIASAVCLWASAAAIARAPLIDTRLIVRATVAGIVFANTRSLSLPMAAIALAAPLLLASRERAHVLYRSTVVRVCVVVIVVGMASGLAWVELSGRVPTNPFARYHFTVLDGLGRSWRLFGDGVASFGSYEVRDLVAIFISAALWGVILVVALRRGAAADRLVLVSVALVALAFPIAVSFVHPPPIYTDWQGRHGLPLWVGVPILAGAIAATAPRQVRGPALGITIAFAAAIGIEQVTSFAAAAHRYAVGLSGRTIYFLHPRWRPPLPDLVLLALMTVGAALLAWRITNARAVVSAA